MSEYVIEGIKCKVYREFDSKGPSILEHTIDYLLNLLEEKDKKQIIEKEE